MIAVIGATGFTGHRVVHALRAARPDEPIVAVVRPSSDRRRLEGTGAILRVADIADPGALRAALHGASTIACIASLGFGHADSICSAVAAEPRRHALFFSSTAIFTRLPVRSRDVRAAAEERIRSSGIPATIVRPTMIYGRPGDRNIERLLRFLARWPVMPVTGDGRALQQPVHVDDLAQTIVVIFDRPQTVGRTYDLPGPEPIILRRLVRDSASAVGRRPLLVPVPMRVAEAAAQAWSRTGWPPHVSAEQIQRLSEDKSANGIPARKDLDYAPRPFATGVADEARLLGLRHSIVGRGVGAAA